MLTTRRGGPHIDHAQLGLVLDYAWLAVLPTVVMGDSEWSEMGTILICNTGGGRSYHSVLELVLRVPHSGMVQTNNR